MEYTPQQLALIEKHRDINVDYEWWDTSYEDFVSVAETYGINVDAEHIHFSGFWSQGDGASFVSSNFSAYDVIMATIKAEEEKPYGDEPTGYAGAFRSLGLLLLQRLGVYALTSPAGRAACESIAFEPRRISRHYCHARTVRVGISFDSSAIDECPAVWGALDLVDPNRPYDWGLEKDVDEAYEAIANALYKSLEGEHDDQTSNDAVWESLTANDITVEDEEDEDVAA